jgi:hypothetical protein
MTENQDGLIPCSGTGYQQRFVNNSGHTGVCGRNTVIQGKNKRITKGGNVNAPR